MRTSLATLVSLVTPELACVGPVAVEDYGPRLVFGVCVLKVLLTSLQEPQVSTLPLLGSPLV